MAKGLGFPCQLTMPDATDDSGKQLGLMPYPRNIPAAAFVSPASKVGWWVTSRVQIPS